MPKFQVTAKLTAEVTLVIEAPSKSAIGEFLSNGYESAGAIVANYGSVDEFNDVEEVEINKLEKDDDSDPIIMLDKEGQVKEED